MLHKYQHRLPHWELKGAYYFITFTISDDALTSAEIRLVRDQIIQGHGKWNVLVAVQVMPDHVHLIIRPDDEVTLGRAMKWIKGSTARLVNKTRERQGTLWTIDYYDRIIRHQQELDEKLKYMYENPLRAGLTGDPAHYKGWYFQES